MTIKISSTTVGGNQLSAMDDRNVGTPSEETELRWRNSTGI